MVGKGVLLECLDHPAVESVLCINRSTLGKAHSKLKEILHSDFSDFSSLRDELKGIDAAYLCMGVSSLGKSEEDYHIFTYDYTMSLVNILYEHNPDMTCIYVSGVGTDSTEKGRVMWARVKGKTENAILNKGFKQAFAFRPGAIIPLKGIRSRVNWYQFIYDYMMWLIYLLKKLKPKSVVDTTQVGLAMINLTMKGYETNHIEPEDIIKISNR